MNKKLILAHIILLPIYFLLLALLIIYLPIILPMFAFVWALITITEEDYNDK